MIANFLRRLFGGGSGPGPIVPGPVSTPPINQTPYDPNNVHPIKNGFAGYPRF